MRLIAAAQISRRAGNGYADRGETTLTFGSP